MTFLEDVWSRNFLNLFASPLSLSEHLSGLVFTAMATSAVGLIVMLALATTLFGLSFFAIGLMIVPFLFVLFLFGIALGIVACTIVLRLGPRSGSSGPFRLSSRHSSESFTRCQPSHTGCNILPICCRHRMCSRG
jgi:hypothetical protein